MGNAGESRRRSYSFPITASGGARRGRRLYLSPVGRYCPKFHFLLEGSNTFGVKRGEENCSFFPLFEGKRKAGLVFVHFFRPRAMSKGHYHHSVEIV